MFNAIGGESDNTFTQIYSGSNADNTLGLLSNYFGNFGVGKSNKSPSNDLIFSVRIKKQSESDKIFHQGEDESSDSSDSLIQIYDNASFITTSFDALASEIGSVDGKISKDQLYTFLQKLLSKPDSNGDLSKAIIFLKNLIAQFDIISQGQDYITSFTGLDEVQDYTTVTSEQLTSPFGILI